MKTGRAWANWRQHQVRPLTHPWHLPGLLAAISLLPIVVGLATSRTLPIPPILGLAMSILVLLTSLPNRVLVLAVAFSVDMALFWILPWDANPSSFHAQALSKAIAEGGFMAIFFMLPIGPMVSAWRDLRIMRDKGLLDAQPGDHDQPGGQIPFELLSTSLFAKAAPQGAWSFRQPSLWWVRDWRLVKLEDGWVLVDLDFKRLVFGAELQLVGGELGPEPDAQVTIHISDRTLQLEVLSFGMPLPLKGH